MSYTGKAEKSTALHFSILAWKIPWMEEPRVLQSMGSLRVRHDFVTVSHAHTHTHMLPYTQNRVV